MFFLPFLFFFIFFVFSSRKRKFQEIGNFLTKRGKNAKKKVKKSGQKPGRVFCLTFPCVFLLFFYFCLPFFSFSRENANSRKSGTFRQNVEKTQKKRGQKPGCVFCLTFPCVFFTFFLPFFHVFFKLVFSGFPYERFL